jgi:hypothetical protein
VLNKASYSAQDKAETVKDDRGRFAQLRQHRGPSARAAQVGAIEIVAGGRPD